MTDEQTNHPKKKKARAGGKPQSGPALDAPPKPEAAAEAARPVHTVGATLRANREKMKLSLEEVSAAINVRVVQLQAIEDEKIDQLPGMTYAVGFVRSYAQFLKLDAQELAATFKREHEGEPAAKTALNFADPIAEDKLPGPVLIGVAAFGIVVLFIGWSLLSSDEGGIEMAQNIPPAPVVGTASGQPTLADSQPLSGFSTGMITPAEPSLSSQASGAASTEEGSTVTAVIAEADPQGDVAASAASAPEMVVRPTRPVADRPAGAAPQVINVKRGKGRILLEARQKSWVQISDGSGKVVYKKVMSPGEQFFVPDQKGMTMVTSNAGGLDVIVDGVKAQSLGRPGEIIRGIALDPEELKKRRIRVRD